MSSTVTLKCKSCGKSRDFPANKIVYWAHGGTLIEDWFLFERSSLCKKCYGMVSVTHPVPLKKMARASDPSTSHEGAKTVAVRAGSQRHQLLTAYGDFSELTADEAMRKAGVSDRSCYWKRISELREGEFIEDTGKERTAESGSLQMVCRITSKGVAAL